MQPKRTSKRLLIFLATAVVVLTLAGLGLLGMYFFLSRQPVQAAEWVNPVTVIVTESVAPDIAVLTLAGEPDDRVVRAALDAGEVEAAYATLAVRLAHFRQRAWRQLAVAGSRGPSA